MLLKIIIVAGLAFMAGIVQTVSGFGNAIVMMLGFPGIFGVTRAAALSGSISMAHSGMLMCRFHKSVTFRKIAVVTMIYTLVGIYCINLSGLLNVRAIGLAYGIFMILLAAYFMFADGKVKMNGLVMVFAGAVISGIGCGFFSIGGPLLAVYYNQIFDDREEYMANLQFTFLVGTVINLIVRIIKGIYTVDLILYSLVGIVFIYLGQVIGLKIAGLLKPKVFSAIIHVLVLLSGIMTVVKNII